MSRIITTAEVKKHNHKDSVWMIIHNDVYDVTDFLDEHPGGEETLLESAGKEATQDFEDVGHSEDARELMMKYKIGTLPAEEHNQAPSAPQPAVATCCPHLPPGLPTTKESKTWRTFDHSPSRSQKSSKTRVRIDPKPSSHLESIVVPRPVEKGSNMKWYILALVGAIVIGVVIKKKLAA